VSHTQYAACVYRVHWLEVDVAYFVCGPEMGKFNLANEMHAVRFGRPLQCKFSESRVECPKMMACL
jgi:hypothetical protein